MGPVKRVLLGSAAGMFAVAGAQAADLPVKAKPVEYVKVCSLYGAGFWYVPGTDTCIKIGAYTKIEANYNADGGGGPIGNNAGTGGRQDRVDTSNFTLRNRNDISFDMRSQTEYGTLRSYIDIGSQIQHSGGNGGATPVGNAISTVYVTRAFLQFAGFTAGRMRSFFDMYFQGAYALASQRMNGDTSPNGINGIAYTWQFGGGLSASFSLEDGGFGTGGRGRSTTNVFGAGGVAGVPAFSTAVANIVDVKGQQFFDPILNIRLDQAWGFVGVSGVLHDASGGYYGNLTTTGHPSDVFGWAAAASFTLTSPFGLQGDTLGAMAVYSRGAIGYATTNASANVFYGSGNSVGLGWGGDGIYTNGGNVELTDAWSFNGAYEHRWDPKWRTSIYGGLVGVIYSGAEKNIICNSAGGPASPLGFTGGLTGAFIGSVSNCSPNWSATQLGSRTMWNPVPDVDVGFDVSWYHQNTAFAGTANLNASGARPAGIYNITNQDSVSAYFRFQRNFLY